MDAEALKTVKCVQSVKLHLEDRRTYERTNERMDKRTYRRRESNLVHLTSNVTSGGNNFNEFPHN